MMGEYKVSMTDEDLDDFDQSPADDSERLMTVAERNKLARSRKRTVIFVVAVAILLSLIVACVATVLGVRLSSRTRPGNSGANSPPLPSDPYERAAALLNDYPVIDGYAVFSVASCLIF